MGKKIFISISLLVIICITVLADTQYISAKSVATIEDLYYKYPQYLDDSFFKSQFEEYEGWCVEAEEEISDMDINFAVCMDAIKNGRKIIVSEVLSKLNIGESNYDNYKKELVNEIIQNYLKLDNDDYIKEGQKLHSEYEYIKKTYKTFDKVGCAYIRDRMGKESVKKLVNAMAESKDFLNVVEKSVSSGEQVLEVYLLLAYYSEIQIDKLDKLIYILDGEDIQDVLVKIRNEIDDNPAGWIKENFIEKDIVSIATKELKKIEEYILKEEIGISPLPIVLADLVFSCTEKIYSNYNPTVDDIMYVLLMNSYSGEAKHKMSEIKNQIQQGICNEYLIDEYNSIFDFYITCLRIRMEKCESSLKDKNSALKSKFNIYKDSLGKELNYSTYINSCLSRLSNAVNNGDVDLTATYKLSCDKNVLLFDKVMNNDTNSVTLNVILSNYSNKTVTLKKPDTSNFITSIIDGTELKEGEAINVGITLESKDYPGNYSEIIRFKIKETTVAFAEVNCGYVVKKDNITGNDIDVSYGQLLIVKEDCAELAYGTVEKIDLQKKQYNYLKGEIIDTIELEDLTCSKINLYGGILIVESNVYIKSVNVSRGEYRRYGSTEYEYGCIYVKDKKELAVEDLLFTNHNAYRVYIIGGLIRILNNYSSENTGGGSICSLTNSDFIFEKNVEKFKVYTYFIHESNGGYAISERVYVDGIVKDCSFSAKEIHLNDDAENCVFDYIDVLEVKGHYTGSLSLYDGCKAVFHKNIFATNISVQNARVNIYGDFHYTGSFYMDNDKSYFCVYGDTYANGITYNGNDMSDYYGHYLKSGTLEFKGNIYSSGIYRGESWGWPYLSYPLWTDDDVKVILSGDEKQTISGRDILFGKLEIDNQDIYTETGFVIRYLLSDWKYEGNLNNIYIYNGNKHTVSVNGNCVLNATWSTGTNHTIALYSGVIDDININVKGELKTVLLDIKENAYIRGESIELISTATEGKVVSINDMIISTNGTDYRPYVRENAHMEIGRDLYINTLIKTTYNSGDFSSYWTSGEIHLRGNLIISTGSSYNYSPIYDFSTGEQLRFFFDGNTEQRIIGRRADIGLCYIKNKNIQQEQELYVGKMGNDWNLDGEGIRITVKNGDGHSIKLSNLSGTLNAKDTSIIVDNNIKPSVYSFNSDGSENYTCSYIYLYGESSLEVNNSIVWGNIYMKNDSEINIKGNVEDLGVGMYDNSKLKADSEECNCNISMYDNAEAKFINYMGIISMNSENTECYISGNAIIQNATKSFINGTMFIDGDLSLINENIKINQCIFKGKEQHNIDASNLTFNKIESDGSLYFSRSSNYNEINFGELESDIIVEKAKDPFVINDWNNYKFILKDTTDENYIWKIRYPDNYMEEVEINEVDGDKRYTHIYRPLTLSSPKAAIPSGSAVDKGTLLELSYMKGSTVYYTLDGSEPTIDSCIYNEPIVINNDVIVRSFAVMDGVGNSEVVDYSYKLKRYNVRLSEEFDYAEVKSGDYCEDEMITIRIEKLEGIEYDDEPIRVFFANNIRTQVEIEELDDTTYSFVMPKNDVCIYFYYTYIDYPIVYENIIEKAVNENPEYYNINQSINLREPKCEEYEFLGWTSENSSEPIRIVSIEKGTIGEKKFIANWRKHKWDEGRCLQESTCDETGLVEYSQKNNNDNNEKIKVGTILTDKKYTYKVTKSGSKDGKVIGEVMVTGLSDVKITKIKIANQVTIEGIKYKVTAVNNKAFKNNKNIIKIYIGNNVKNIGSSAFNNCSNLKNVIIKSTKLKKIGNKAFYKKKGSKIKFVVPKSKKKTYKKLLKKAKTKKWSIK